jgi:predicted metal-binding protein
LIKDEVGIEDLSCIVRESGATRARMIKAKDVAVRDWVRYKCQYGCPKYNQSLTCPPRSPSPDQTRRILSEYDQAIILEFKEEKGRKWTSVNETMVEVEKKAFLVGYYAAIGLASGPCKFCEKCNLSVCVHPQLARPSMEACGIDVYTTVRMAGLEINVVQNRKQKPTHFGLLLVR